MQRAVTVRHVAVNGVMAGCPPEFMPLLLAFAECMKAGDFRRTLVSTHAWTPYCWLNGPVARQLGFDCGQGEISEPKNMMLGRFVNLALLNLGGYRIKENRMGGRGEEHDYATVARLDGIQDDGDSARHADGQEYLPGDGRCCPQQGAVSAGRRLRHS